MLEESKTGSCKVRRFDTKGQFVHFKVYPITEEGRTDLAKEARVHTNRFRRDLGLKPAFFTKQGYRVRP